METLRVRELMTWDVVTILPDMDTEAAWDLMSDRQLRHLVVVDRDGDLVGVVSHRDLLRQEPVGAKLASEEAWPSNFG